MTTTATDDLITTGYTPYAPAVILEAPILTSDEYEEVAKQTVKFASTQIKGQCPITSEDIVSETIGNTAFADALFFPGKTVILDVQKAIEIIGHSPIIVEGQCLLPVNGFNSRSTGVRYTRETRPKSGFAVTDENDKQNILLVMGYTYHDDLAMRPVYTLVVDTELEKPQYSAGITVWEYPEEAEENRFTIEPHKNFGFYANQTAGSNLKEVINYVMWIARGVGIPIKGTTSAQFGTKEKHRAYSNMRAKESVSNQRRVQTSVTPAYANGVDPFVLAGLG